MAMVKKRIAVTAQYLWLRSQLATGNYASE